MVQKNKIWPCKQNVYAQIRIGSRKLDMKYDPQLPTAKPDFVWMRKK